MHKKLKEIADIFSGYNLHRKVENDPSGNCRLIQMKDVDKNCGIHVNNLPTICVPNIKNLSYIRKDDILFKSKSNNNIACIMPGQHENLIASAHFLIIRVKDTSVLPAYLAWFINQKPAQRYFELFSGGSTVSVVTKKILGDLEINILPVNKQIHLLKLEKLRKKEIQLETKIADLKEKLYNERINKLIK